MKKILSISFLFLYLATAIGVNISLHYCGEQLADVAVLSKTTCCCEDKNEADDCCKNETKSFKLKVDQNKVDQTNKLCSTFEFSVNFLHSRWYEKISQHGNEQATLVQLPNPPDEENSIPLYKKHHSFLFYS